MIVGIVGSRDFNNFELFEKKILEWEKVNGSINKIVSGGCRGVDKLAELFAKKYKKSVIIHNAEWKKYGRKAGPKRNSLIVADSEHIIAFPSDKSVGTYDTIKKAQNRGIKTTIFKI
jgi:predicted Rossmann fold nucleotide-binding protein DprA/Smf involved in DNA uptake